MAQERPDFLQSLDTSVPAESVSTPNVELLERRNQILNNLDRYISSQTVAGRARVLREKQMAVFRDIHESLSDGNTEGYIDAPTGFGKTVLFSEVIRAVDQRTLVVVPKIILVEQTYRRLKQFNPNIDIGRVYGDRKERGHRVTVTTYNSLVRANGGTNPEDIDLLVLDEVHQSLTEDRIRAVQRFGNAVKLGFTATPEYTEDKRVENLLNNRIHEITLREGVETGLLCSFSVYLARTDVDLTNVRINQYGEYDEKELEEAINVYSRNKSAIELYHKLVEHESSLSKALVFCATVRHAREVADLFNQSRVSAAAVWSGQNKKDQREFFEKYSRGEIKVLTNVNILTEGFDDPEAALCINLRPTLSKVVAKQRGGRILRLDEENPRKHAVIVDYLDKNEDRQHLQVTFAQVAEGSQILTLTPPTGATNRGRGSGRRGRIIDIDPSNTSLNMEGLEVITNAEEVLRIIRELEKQLLTTPPDGWITISTLYDDYGISPNYVRARTQQYRGVHPDWFKEFKNQVGFASEYYSPELTALLKSEAERRLPVETGWQTANQVISRMSHVAHSTIIRTASAYRDLHPEWFRKMHDSGGREFEFFSSELVKIIIENLDKRQGAPEGWMTNAGYSSTTGIHPKTISRFVDNYRESNPEWFAYYSDGIGRKREHFSPGLIEELDKARSRFDRYNKRKLR